MPRLMTAASLLPYLMGGQPYTTPPIGGAHNRPSPSLGGAFGAPQLQLETVEPPASPLSPQGPILGNGTPSRQSNDPIMRALRDAPMGLGDSNTLAAQMMHGLGTDSGPPQTPNIAKRKAFDGKGFAGMLLGALSDGMLAYAGRPAIYTPALLAERENQRDENRFQQRLQAQIEADRQKYLAPRVEQVGNTVGWVDPSARRFEPIFTAPSPAEQYAAARGFTPGTPEYQAEVETYRLGSWSDPAVEAKETLEGVRFDNRKTLQDDRLGVTRRGQDFRSRDTRRGQDMRSGDTRRGQDTRSRDYRDSAGFRGRGKGAGGAAPKAMLNGRPIVVRGGQWLDEATGKPVS